MADGPERERERRRWREHPRVRPREIEVPGPGRESVWDYPRPPRVEPVARELRVIHAGVVVAETRRGLRVIETSSPPVYYFPSDDVGCDLLEASEHETFCEWKGLARRFHLRCGGARVERACWSYPEPDAGFEAIRGAFAFYPSRVDACTVGSERVRAQSGDYYGGWITPDIAGPFKGGPGSESW